jgi:hypothetical protein
MKEIAPAKYAVDFVILPSESVADLAISLNKKTLQRFHHSPRQGSLYSPHFSFDGLSWHDQLDEATTLLKRIALTHAVMK